MGTEDPARPTIRETEPEALANVAAVLRLCQTGTLRCSEKTRRPSAATVRAVAEVLVAGDFYPDDAVAAFAWPLLLQAGGLARLEGSRLALTPSGLRALGRPPHEVIRGLWERWPKYAPIDEFSRVEQIKGQKAAGALSAAGPRRQVVAAALTVCPQEKWIGVDNLFREMWRAGLNPTIARSERAKWKLYLVDAEYGSMGYAGYGEWPVLEGRYTLAVLFEYAATLGLLDVEYLPPEGVRDDFRDQWGADWIDALSRYDGLTAVRLTALGAYAAGLSPDYTPPAVVFPDPPLQVLPNLDVVAVADLAAPDRLVLDAFATRSSDRVWTLSLRSLLAAVDAGRAIDEFAEFLTGRAKNELPTTVTTLFDDVAARSRQVRALGLHLVVECADAHVATLLERDLRGLCTRIGERHLIVEASAEPKARAALRRLGYPLGPTAR